MKTLVYLLTFLLWEVAWSGCLCQAYRGEAPFYQKEMSDENACKEALAAASFELFENGMVCSGTKSETKKDITISWMCGEEAAKEKSFACEDFQSMSDAKKLLNSTLLAQSISKPEDLEPGRSAEIGKLKCDGRKEAEALPIKPVSKDGEGVLLQFEDEKSLRAFIKRIIPNAPDHQSVLDSVENGSIRFLIHNDNYWNRDGKARGDDMGDTHGFELSATKALNGGHNVGISYESNLYTNFEDPVNKGFWRDTQGNLHVAQNFIEENIGKIMIEKAKKGDAFYWSAGGGVHQLNKSDGDGTFGRYSAMGSQIDWHKAVARRYPGTATLFDNKGQDDDEVEPFVQFNAGKRQVLAQFNRTKAFADVEGAARITGVDDASMASVSGRVGVERKLGGNGAVRAVAGRRSAVYSDSSKLNARFVDVIIGTRKVQTGFRYENRYDPLPSYQNALPEDYAGRDDFAPRDESVWRLYVQYQW